MKKSGLLLAIALVSSLSVNCFASLAPHVNQASVNFLTPSSRIDSYPGQLGHPHVGGYPNPGCPTSSGYPPHSGPVQYQTTKPPTNQSGSYKLSDAELYDRGHTRLVQGNFSAALIFFGQLIKQYPRSPLADDAALWLGKTYQEMGDFESASRAFASFKRSYPGSELLPDAKYSLASSYYQVALIRYANREYFRKAASEFINFTAKYGYHRWAPEALYMAGESYERYGDYNSAKSYYRQVVARYPSSSAALKAREKLSGMF